MNDSLPHRRCGGTVFPKHVLTHAALEGTHSLLYVLRGGTRCARAEKTYR
jgi:hypothetical protein